MTCLNLQTGLTCFNLWFVPNPFDLGGNLNNLNGQLVLIFSYKVTCLEIWLGSTLLDFRLGLTNLNLWLGLSSLVLWTRLTSFDLWPETTDKTFLSSQLDTDQLNSTLVLKIEPYQPKTKDELNTP